MKIFTFLLLLFPFGLWAQNGFEQKKKNTDKSIKVKGFEVIDGRAANKSLRKAQPSVPAFELKALPLYKTIKSDEDPTFIHIENLKSPSTSKNAKVTTESKVYSFWSR